MTQRNRLKTIHGGPQGDESELVILCPTIREQQTFLRESQILAQTNPQAEDVLTREYLLSHVVSYNWVSDNGTPLPQMKDCPEIINDLLKDEWKFILQAIQGTLPSQVAEKKEIENAVRAILFTKRKDLHVPWEYTRLRLAKEIYHIPTQDVDELAAEVVNLDIAFLNIETEVAEFEAQKPDQK